MQEQLLRRSKHTFKYLTASLGLLLAFAQGAPGFGDEQPPSAASDAGTADASAAPAAQSDTKEESTASAGTTPLKGSVQTLEVDLQDLHEIGLDLKKLQHSANDLYDEVTIHPVSMETEPEIVGAGTIIYIPIGVQSAGFVQPRKDHVDLAMEQMTPIISMLKKDVDAVTSGQVRLGLSDQLKDNLKPLFDQWVQLVNDVSAKLSVLGPLTQGPQYDNSQIANAAATIHTDAKKLEDARKKIYKAIQKEGKELKKAESKG